MGLWFSGISLALQPFSDLDLVIFSEPDNTVDYMEIQEIFDESTCSSPWMSQLGNSYPNGFSSKFCRST